ncbi:MAG: pentapeptide repeat-containing protein [Lachnospiraceae bacterium]|nr:pentapeptide repeat-containing protein [Lachnospiraceae bacterium]
MKTCSEKEVKDYLQIPSEKREKDFLSNIIVENADFAGLDFSNQNLEYSSFWNCNLEGANFSRAFLKHGCFTGSNLKNCNFRNANLVEADLRRIDISGSDFTDADMRFTALEGADMSNIIVTDGTNGMHMLCPEEGAFIGWKVCFDYRIVMLLVPADAKRRNGTSLEIRVDKAKVMTITSVDYKENFDEAMSYVDQDFFYKKGQWVFANNFDDRRFVDSAGGIHIWMDRQAAVDYMAKNV